MAVVVMVLGTLVPILAASTFYVADRWGADQHQRETRWSEATNRQAAGSH